MNNDPLLKPLRILIAASEAQSLIGSDDLAEYITTLSATLGAMGHDIRLVLPAYPQVIAAAEKLTPLARVCLIGSQHDAQLFQGKLNPDVTLYLVEIPGQFDRPGTPYADENGVPWNDNGLRFGLFSRVITLMAINQAGINWQPDLLHCHGWQTALAISLLAGEWSRPATVYTLHQSEHPYFTSDQITPLSVPVEILKSGALSIDGHFSYERGALLSADRITTPSPGFTVALVNGDANYPLADILRSRLDRIDNIPAGIDYHRWSPTTDQYIEQHFDSSSFELKQMNRERLLAEFNLNLADKTLLIGYLTANISLEETELIASLFQEIAKVNTLAVIAFVAGNEEHLEPLQAYQQNPTANIRIHIGTDESVTHRILAGSDCLLLPSQLSPSPRLAQCALSYGTIPVAHATNSMQEILSDATPANLLNGMATAFLYKQNTLDDLLVALDRIQKFRAKPAIWWKKLALQGMDQSFHSSETAHSYLEIYQQAIDNPAPSLAGSQS
ncbi:MAG: glycogen/starch synthase [Sedimenticola sp.]|nr:glycogen/starch synthase [Sedimenticola sp.]